MAQSKQKQITTVKDLVLVTLILGVMIAGFLFGAIVERSILFFVIAGFLAFILATTVSSFMMHRSFLRSIRQQPQAPKSATETESQLPTATDVVDTDLPAFDRPPFRSVVYDRDNIPNLNPAAEQQWNRIQNRFKELGKFTGLVMILTTALGFLLLLASTVLPASQSLALGPYFIFAVLTVGVSGFLLAGNIRTAAVFGITAILGLVWLVIPFAEAFRLLLSENADQNLPQVFFLLVGGSVVLAARRLVGVRFRNRHRVSLEDADPAKLLFLWVFGTDVGQELFVNFGFKWQVLGPVYFLNGKGMMETDSVKTFMKMIKGERQVVETPRDFDRLKRSYSDVPDKYGQYKLQSVLCGDAVWKIVLDDFLANQDLILMSLCGYTANNKGCEFELGKLIDEVPTGKVVFLVNDNTDMSELDSDMRGIWNRMKATSPNLRANPEPVQIYRLQTHFMSELDDKFDEHSTNETRLRFQRLKQLAAEGDQIIRLLCQARVRQVTP